MIKQFVDRESPQKLYLQIYQIFLDNITGGAWPVSSQIPTEEQLCAIYNVSKATIRLAISELVRQGYLKRQQGKGTFVSTQKVPDGLVLLTSLREFMLESGLSVTTSVLVQTVMMPVGGLDSKLDITPDKHLIYLKRLQIVEEEPTLLQHTYIPHHFIPSLLDEDVGRLSMIDVLEKNHGFKITQVKNNLEMTQLANDDAALLKERSGACALLLSQHFYSGGNQIMYTKSLKRSDRFKLSIDLERKPV